MQAVELEQKKEQRYIEDEFAKMRLDQEQMDSKIKEEAEAREAERLRLEEIIKQNEVEK